MSDVNSPKHRSMLGSRRNDPSLEDIKDMIDNDSYLCDVKEMSDKDFLNHRSDLIQFLINLKIRGQIDSQRNDVLAVRLETQIAINESLEEKNEELKKDSLTGLFTRAYLPKVLEKLDSNKEYSVLFIDLNFFKSFNDDYNHSVGDQALVYLSEKIKDLIRGEDMVAKCESDEALRWAGDEFIILLPDTDMSGAIIVAERLNKLLELDVFRFLDKSQQEVVKPVTLSTGIASGVGVDSFSSVQEEADNAAYVVKTDMDRKGIAVKTNRGMLSSEEYKAYLQKN